MRPSALPPVLLIIFCLFAPSLSRAEESPRILVSIAPIHSLAAALMDGAGQPDLLLPPGPSPHDVVLKPSQLRLLRVASLVIWVGANLETFLIEALGKMDPGTVVLALDPRQPETAGHEDGHEDGHGHGHGAEDDPHGWLDPRTAALWAEQMARALTAIDPNGHALHASNLETLKTRLRELDRALEARLAPVRNRPFIVYHPAYGHLVERYGLKQVGVVTTTPEQSIGARHLKELRDLVEKGEVVCLFIEPGADPRMAKAIGGDRTLRVAQLDPLGAAFTPGPDLYFQMMTRLTEDLADCLKE